MIFDILGQFKRIPDLIQQASSALNRTDPTVTSLVNVYNSVASVFGKKTISNDSVGSTVRDIVDGIGSMFSSASSRAMSLNKSISEVSANARVDESLFDAAERLKNEPTAFALTGHIKNILDNVSRYSFDPNFIQLTDVSKFVPTISKERNVIACNGGTIDMLINNPDFATIRDTAGASVALTLTSGFSRGYNNLFGEASSANSITGFISAAMSGPREVTIMTAQGTHANYTATFQVRIPRGVPSGRLRVIAHRTAIERAYINNPGAGNDLSIVNGGASGAATLVANGETWLSWSALNDVNEGMGFSKRISKAYGVDMTIDFTYTATTANAIHNVSLNFEYYPESVTLESMTNLGVDLSANDPLAIGLDYMLKFDDHCRAMGCKTFLEEFNGRLSAAYTEAVLYPTNWNTLSIDQSASDFVQTYVAVWNGRRTMMIADPGFLKKV